MKITNIKTIAVTSIITLALTLMSVYAYESQMRQKMMPLVEEPCQGTVGKSAAQVKNDADLEEEVKREVQNLFAVPGEEIKGNEHVDEMKKETPPPIRKGDVSSDQNQITNLFAVPGEEIKGAK